MFGLAIIFFMLLYLIVWALLVIGAVYFGIKILKSKKAAIIFGVIGFLVGYWPAFGDLIPTLWAYKQLCEKEAGFKVYVTPEQWDKQNPGVLSVLQPYEKYTFKDHILMGNERLGSTYTLTPINDGAIKRKLGSIIDTKTGAVLIQDVDFSRGYGGLANGDDNRSIKFWLNSNSCFSDNEFLQFNKKKIEFYRNLKIKK